MGPEDDLSIWSTGGYGNVICQFVWQAGSCSCQRSYGVISTRLQPVLDSNLYSVQSIQSRVVIRTLTDYGIQSIVPRSRHILLLYVYVLHINCMFGGGPIFHMMLYSIGRSSENKQQTTEQRSVDVLCTE